MTDTPPNTKPDSHILEQRVVILAPFGRDAQVAEQTFGRAGLASTAATSTAHLIRELERGVGVMMIASEALDPRSIQQITAALAEQPSWSEIPIVILTPPMPHRPKPFDAVRALGPTGNVTFLPRPITVEQLFGTVRFALRSRQRQYDMRDLLVKLDRNALELQRSNAELENYAYVAAHDMQEPLRMIDGHLGILARKYADALGPPGMQYLTAATDGARRMRAMLHALLKYAQVGSGALTPVQVSLTSVAHEAVLNLASAVESSHGVVDIPSEDVTVLGDPALLSQLFQNLIGNALKFHKPDIAPHVQITWTPSGEGWRCAIADNGIGIAPEATQRIFQLFQRQQSVQDYPGSGIGLATCRRIVELHGGSIRVDSKPGSGSTFHIAVHANPEPPGTRDYRKRPAHILAIDDNPHDVLLLEEACSAIALEIRITSANDGLQAQAVMTKLAQAGDAPDLITVDLNMPIADGFSVLAFMRERALFQGVPLIVLTSSAATRDRERAISLGADQFTSKPGTFEELVELIRSWKSFLSARSSSGRTRSIESGDGEA